MTENMDLNYIEEFSAAIVGNLQMMAGSDCTVAAPMAHDDAIFSAGISVIVGITGKRPGRIILDTDLETAKKLAVAMNDDEDVDENLLLDSIAEFCNIVSGHTTTRINNNNKGLGLMLTPPGIFMGKDLKVISPRIQSKIITAESSLGVFTVSVGFERGI
jgi:CheY-specific phosphatase CheX